MANKLSRQLPVFFTPEQIRWLENEFPETYHLASPQELAFRAGQRSVVHAVMRKRGGSSESR